jgi:hypothetical protein
MKSNKIVPCPICSREIELSYLRDVRVYYNGCDPCRINIFEIDGDIAWVKEHSEVVQHHWWIFKSSPRYWGTGLPRMPFELHFQIKEPDTQRVAKLTDLVFTLYKKMWMGYQIPLDVNVLISERDDEENKTETS